MTSGTSDENKLENVFSNNVIFPTESLASAENGNHKSGEEEEEEAQDELHEESQVESHEESQEESRSLQEQQEQTVDQLLNNNDENNNNPPKSKKVDKKDVDALSEQFLAGEPVESTDPILLSSVVASLEDRRDLLMMNGDFHESIKTQKAVDAARSRQLQAVKKQAADKEVDIINQKRSQVEMQYEKFQKQMDKQEEDIEKEINKQIQSLKAKQQKEIDKHDEDWQNEKKQGQYNRASQRLRVLRTQQQLLMNAKRFEEAEQVCKIADGVAEQEAKESHKQMLSAYKSSRRKLQQKHDDEFDTLMRSCEQKRETFKHQKITLSQPYINRFNNLNREQEIAKDPERLWILKYRNDEKQRKTCNATSRNTKTAKQQNQTQSISKNIQAPSYNKLEMQPLFQTPSPTKKRKEKGSNTKEKPQQQ